MLAGMCRILSIFVVLILFAGTSLLAEERCSSEALHKATEHALAVQARLLAVKVGQNGIDTEVASSTQIEIRAFKTAILATTDTFMQCEPVFDKGVAEGVAGVERRLAEGLNANRKEADSVDSNTPESKMMDGIYGAGLRVKAKELLRTPLTLAIQVNFGVDCGGDNVLLVYAWKQGRWQRVLLWQAPDYDTVGGAFGDFFEYQLIPHGGREGWALSVAYGHPWCSSRWSGFDMDVLEPIEGQAAPRVLMHLNEGYVRFEVEPRMKLMPDGFELRLEVGTVESDVMTRMGIYRYQLAGGVAQRVQPVAMNGRDFVDAWVQSPWSDASRWSSPDTLDSLEKEHAKISGIQNLYNEKTDELRRLDYGPVQRCSDERNHYQMTLFATKVVHSKDFELPTTYFQIEQEKNSFTMLSASEKPDPRCSGGDLMASH
jgi:hypothetical protein